MSLDWTHQFCLACDKQTDGTTYCSESCRLAEYEKSPSSELGSPTAAPTLSWTFTNPVSSSRVLYLPLAYDFSNAQPYGTTPRRTSTMEVSRRTSSQAATQQLSPSNSHTSLCSMRSNTSTDSTLLSEDTAKELRAYARSFESVRMQRRRSH